ncbi:MAG: Do family serine endopeptidase [Acidobacteria bacterium]|nr:Do family serine endopeptidase [Acidobacteriota bacterium]
MRASFSVRSRLAAVLVLASGYCVVAAPPPPPPPPQITGFADVVSKDSPAVVSIYTTSVEKGGAADSKGQMGFAPVPRAGSRPRKKRSAGEGSGVIVEPNGTILTNHHVIDKATSITVRLSDGRDFDAKLVASDARTDLAVVRVDAKGLPTIPFGDSSKVRVGDFTLAIGNPFGIGQTVTLGIISATGRSDVGIEELEDFLQTDAAINPGNSGGALINAQGELVGINTAIYSPEGANNGVGFAIPANLARKVMQQLLTDGKVTRGFLGITMQPMSPQLAQALGVPDRFSGTLVSDVAAGSPAAAAGIEKADVVVAVDGKPVHDLGQLKLAIGLTPPGASVRLTLHKSGGVVRDVTVKLGERKEKPDAASSTQATENSEDIIDGAVLTQLSDALRRELDLSDVSTGIVVAKLDPSSDAAAAGLRPGDVIQAVDRKPVIGLDDLKAELTKPREGKKNALVEVLREGGSLFLALPLD